jgi:hypothetical protein
MARETEILSIDPDLHNTDQVRVSYAVFEDDEQLFSGLLELPKDISKKALRAMVRKRVRATLAELDAADGESLLEEVGKKFQV